MSYEDYMCDNDFQVESSADFLNNLDGEERDFLYSRSGMKACPNCGEFVSKLQSNGICYLCSKSDFHQSHRGSQSMTTSNMNADIDFFKEFNER